MENLRAAPSSRYLLKSFSENFCQIPKKILLKKSCFNNVADSRPETLQKHNLTEEVYLQILRIFQNKFFLKIFVLPPLDGVYFFREKTSPKYVQNVAKKMWLRYSICWKLFRLQELLTTLNFWENFWECFQDFDFFCL